MKHFILIFILLFSTLSFAQKDTMRATLPEIVITATRVPTSAIQLASSFTLINREEIVNKQKTGVIDLLREIPGLAVTQSGGVGTMSNVFIRGANTNHTLVILDGAVLNDPSSTSGAYDFSSLSTDNIERIEIVRGPQSTLYGSDAIAGIVNIFSRRPSEGFKISLNAETGSNNLYKGNLSALGAAGPFSYALSYHRLKTDGISAASSKYGNTEKDKFENNVFSSNLRLNVLPNLTAGLIYRYTKSKGDLDQNEKLGDDPNFRTDLEEHLVRGTIESEIIEGKWSATLGFSNVRKIGHTIDEVDELHPAMSSFAFNNGTRTKFDWQNELNIINNNRIIAGVETEVERANTSYLSEGAWGPYFSEFTEQSLRTTGVYIQDQFSIGEKLNGAVGFRYDRNEKFGGQTTFRIAPTYFITETGTKIKATYGTGFKAPSLYYLFDPMYGNPDLKPEKSIGWDAGIEQFFLNFRLSVGVTLFQIKFDQMFGIDANYKTINLNKAESNGVEAFINYTEPQLWSAKLNYTYTFAVDKSDGSAEKDLLLLRRPMHKASFEFGYNLFTRLSLNSSIIYVGQREDKDFSAWPAARVKLADYTLVNFSASYRLADYISISAKLENIFDKYYEDILYYGTMGRNFSVGINLNY